MKNIRALFSVVLSVVLLFQSVTVSASSIQSKRNSGDTHSSRAISNEFVNTAETNEESIKEASVLYEVSSN